MPKFTYFLLLLVVSTLGLSFVRRTYSLSTAIQAPLKPDRLQEAKQHFPTAEYDEPDLSDSAQERGQEGKTETSQ
jgi:cytochrome c biogenesis protein ResB